MSPSLPLRERLERGDQRAVAADSVGSLGPIGAESVGRLAEQLVLDAEQGAAPGGEVPAPAQTHR